MSGCSIVFAAIQEQLEVAQGRVVRLRDANAVLTEQVVEAERAVMLLRPTTPLRRLGRANFGTIMQPC